MATAAELTCCNSIRAAEGVRQVAAAAALATFNAAGQAGSALATYIAALQAAGNTYTTSVISALNTLGAAGYTIPNTGGTNPGNCVPAALIIVPGVDDIGNGTATWGAIP